MANAKLEFLEHTKDKPIKCAYLAKAVYYPKDEEQVVLKKDYSPEELSSFLTSIDFEYDSGFGGQELMGVIWYWDETWSDRREYDGSEWWEHQIVPDLLDYMEKEE